MTTLNNYYLLDNQTVELPWKQEEVVLLFTFKSEGVVVGWSWVLYSDKTTELDVYTPPVPEFQQLVQVQTK